ncbi:MAG: transcriptional repressor [Candidatus Omnitrophica bacterium]|nr:transcriptional repressor [Candidatus Omnitrophota bacterium]
MFNKIKHRNTKQRKVILEELKKTTLHPTAEMLFKMVKKRSPKISFGTVYRNLNLLKEQGQILELTCGKDSCRYDGDITPHYHFFCLTCKKVFDLNISVLDKEEKLYKDIYKKTGLAIKYHRLDFYGYCKECEIKMKEIKKSDK